MFLLAACGADPQDQTCDPRKGPCTEQSINAPVELEQGAEALEASEEPPEELPSVGPEEELQPVPGSPEELPESRPQLEELRPVVPEEIRPLPPSEEAVPVKPELLPEARPRVEELKPVQPETLPEARPEIRELRPVAPEEIRPQPPREVLVPVKPEVLPEARPRVEELKPVQPETLPEARPEIRELRPVAPEEIRPQPPREVAVPVKPELLPEARPELEELKPAPTGPLPSVKVLELSDIPLPVRKPRHLPGFLPDFEESWGLSRGVYDQAVARLSEIVRTDRGKRYFVVIDFSLHSSKKRFFLFNLQTGALERYLTSHGEGSDPGKKGGTGYAQHFSNDMGETHKSSLGLYQALWTYQGGNGYSLRLEGLDATNSNAFRRYIVVHPANYISEKKGRAGRSWGCPALDPSAAKSVIDRLKGTWGKKDHKDKRQRLAKGGAYLFIGK